MQPFSGRFCLMFDKILIFEILVLLLITKTCTQKSEKTYKIFLVYTFLCNFTTNMG